ncbi:hypothetical protein Csa_017218 [Cucumis sativus]|nr:hypothetical protein Csa_017218 [Cucumis sativus]
MAPILIPMPSPPSQLPLFSLSSLPPSSPHPTPFCHRKSSAFAREKLSHLHFYFHDIVSGRNPTALIVVPPPSSNASRTLFGAVVMTDDPLTERPEIGSKLLGKAQGFYAGASKTEFGLLMVMNFAFVEGKYNGSYLSILGRNTIMSAVRERCQWSAAAGFSDLLVGMLWRRLMP